MSSVPCCFGFLASLRRPGGRQGQELAPRRRTVSRGELATVTWDLDCEERHGATPSPCSIASRRSRRHTSIASSCSACKRRHVLDVSLGVIRLDYYYPTQVGDVDDAESFEYPVIFRAVPGLTFEMCQAGRMTPEVEEEFVKAIRDLDQKGVSAITGDCGFMLWFQELARRHTLKPICMSSLCMLPGITNFVSPNGKIAIFTAHSRRLESMHDLILRMCGLEVHDERYIIVGCEDLPGFEPIFEGKKLNYELAEPGIVAKALRVMEEQPVSAFVFECMQLPPLSDAVREATKRPVFDAVTTADSIISAFAFNPRFGITEWDLAWDGVRKPYVLGDCLTPCSKAKLVTIQRGNTEKSLLGGS